MGDLEVYALCGAVVVSAMVAVFIIRKRSADDILTIPFPEFKKHYLPGLVNDFHYACARRAYPRCWRYRVPLHPPLVMTANPAVVQHMLVANFGNYEKGPHWRSIFADLLGSGIFNADGPNWKKQRKVASHEFSVNSLRGFMLGVFADRSDSLVAVVAAGGGGAVDAQELFAQYTLQTIGQIGFGLDLGALDGGDAGDALAADFGDAFNAATQCTGDRFADPFWRLKRLCNVGGERRLRDAVARVRAFSAKVIADRRGASVDDLKTKPDSLSRFMALEDAKGKWSFNDAELHDMVISFVLAGRDTTANQSPRRRRLRFFFF
jgi:cytochrome P450